LLEPALFPYTTLFRSRTQVMQGATFAGLAFGVAGTAAAHAIQYPVGAVTHTAHGAGVACLMPWVMHWNRPAIGPELERMAAVMGDRKSTRLNSSHVKI